MFYQNDLLLEEPNLQAHFQNKNKDIFYEKKIDYKCIKGKGSSQNQDNMFIITDGQVKIMGVFDGHGKKGHQVSSFAMSKMLEFLTKRSDRFLSDQFEIAGTSWRKLKTRAMAEDYQMQKWYG